MKTSGILLLTVILTLAMFFVTGCQNGQQTTDKQARMVSIENRKLNEKIDQLNNTIGQYKNDLQQCRRKNRNLQEKIDTKIEQNVQDVLSVVLNKNKQLQDEIARLKSQ